MYCIDCTVGSVSEDSSLLVDELVELFLSDEVLSLSADELSADELSADELSNETFGEDCDGLSIGALCVLPEDTPSEADVCPSLHATVKADGKIKLKASKKAAAFFIFFINNETPLLYIFVSRETQMIFCDVGTPNHFIGARQKKQYQKKGKKGYI